MFGWFARPPRRGQPVGKSALSLSLEWLEDRAAPSAGGLDGASRGQADFSGGPDRAIQTSVGSQADTLQPASGRVEPAPGDFGSTATGGPPTAGDGGLGAGDGSVHFFAHFGSQPLDPMPVIGSVRPAVVPGEEQPGALAVVFSSQSPLPLRLLWPAPPISLPAPPVLPGMAAAVETPHDNPANPRRAEAAPADEPALGKDRPPQFEAHPSARPAPAEPPSLAFLIGTPLPQSDPAAPPAAPPGARPVVRAAAEPATPDGGADAAALATDGERTPLPAWAGELLTRLAGSGFADLRPLGDLLDGLADGGAAADGWLSWQDVVYGLMGGAVLIVCIQRPVLPARVARDEPRPFPWARRREA